MNTLIEARKSWAAWESSVRKRRVSWRQVHVKSSFHKEWRLYELLVTHGARSEIAFQGISRRECLSEMTRVCTGLRVSTPAFDAMIDRLIAAKRAEILSHGIDPGSLSGYALFGKFDPANPYGVSDEDV